MANIVINFLEIDMALDSSISAALYVRASTEHQNYSTRHQEAALREYASTHNFSVVTVYRDEGRSGLTLDGRQGLRKLLTDIQSGQAMYEAVLVYDVSRWGRFQDVDESAYYEYACRRAGIELAYCAEPFANDGSPLTTVLKGIKRAMAAEYSRELSSKVHHAQCRLSAAGFKQGGSAGYGLRRQCISATGERRKILEMGERKSMPSDRITLVHGPAEEVAVVRRIFDMYCQHHMSDTGIAELLNLEGLTNQHGRSWSSHNIKAVLTNEKYAGALIFNRSTQRLKTSRRPNDITKWIKIDGAFDGIVTKEIFDYTNELRRHRGRHWTNDEMLDGLREILVEHGRVTPELISQSGLPAAKSYVFRFSSLIAAYEAAGVSESSLCRATITRYRLRCVTKDISAELERCALLAGTQVEKLTHRIYRLRGVTVRVLCTRSRYERSHPCWKVTLQYDLAVDFIIWVRMDEANENVAGIYLLPTAAFPEHKYVWPSTRTLARYEQFRHSSLTTLFGLDSASQRIS
jgi:DNA invertase Pin-like site-specific DNA recombinase